MSSVVEILGSERRQWKAHSKCQRGHAPGEQGRQTITRRAQLKSDAEGKASFEGVPYGKLRVQVLATGFQTFGEDYDIDQPVEEITVKMKRPQQQYSIYEDQPPKRKTIRRRRSQKEQPK